MDLSVIFCPLCRISDRARVGFSPSLLIVMRNAAKPSRVVYTMGQTSVEQSKYRDFVTLNKRSLQIPLRDWSKKNETRKLAISPDV